MTILLPLFLILLLATFVVWIAVFSRTTPASADWREDWPEWLNNVVCILPTSTGSASE